MLVATDAQRQVRSQQLEAQKAREGGRSAAPVSTTVAQLVRENRAMKPREEKCGQRRWKTWQPSDALMRLLSPQTPSDTVVIRERVLSFCAETDGDRGLRLQAEAMGIYPDQWREWIDYA